MLDLGIAKLGVIGVVALIVLGPTRLPQVARTLGTLFGRAQRYLQLIRSEISQQLDIDALAQVQNSVHEAAHTARQTLRDALYPSSSSLEDQSSSWAQQKSFDTASHYDASRSKRVRRRSYPSLLYRAHASYLPYTIHYRRHIHSQAARMKKSARR